MGRQNARFQNRASAYRVTSEVAVPTATTTQMSQAGPVAEAPRVWEAAVPSAAYPVRWVAASA